MTNALVQMIHKIDILSRKPHGGNNCSIQSDVYTQAETVIISCYYFFGLAYHEANT